MATEEVFRHDGGPLERSHLRDMVQRNALENTAFNKVTNHLEKQKKAFVRQNTRDEGEMKSLLNRLQNEQHTTLEQPRNADDVLSDADDEVTMADVYDEPQQQVANPYPITIIPRFSGVPYVKMSNKNSVSGTNRPGSSKLNNRRKSIEYEDIQDSLSSMTVSQMSSTTSGADQASNPSTGSSRDETIGDWLASPNAISSVRRLRKSITEQAQMKILARTNSELLVQHDYGCGSPRSGSPLHSRSNSLKDKKRHDSVKDDVSSPRISNVSRRGGSLKERKRNSTTEEVLSPRIRPIARSYSMLTKTSVAEFNQRQEGKVSRQASDKSLDITEITDEKGGDKMCIRTGSLKEKPTSVTSTDQNVHITRKSSKKGNKPGLSGKNNSESSTSYDDQSTQRAIRPKRTLGVAESPDSSPAISPLAKENNSFKY